MKTVYIMGRGHSGSTFLDVVLGNSNEIESVGEILSGLNRGESEDCSCGSKLQDCGYWSEIRYSYKKITGRSLVQDGKFLYKKSDIRYFLSYALGLKKEEQKKYSQINNDIFETLAKNAGVDCIVDSNKEYTRGLLLLLNNSEAKVIHLYRDPIKLASSHYYRQNKGIPYKFMKRSFNVNRLSQPFIIAFLGFTWGVGMLLAIYLNLRFRNRILNISYEDFCRNPDMILKKISNFTDANLDDSLRKINEAEIIPVGHNLGGNELRHEGGFRFVANSGGRRKMPVYLRFIVFCTSFPGMLLSLGIKN
jgi:hypothetical protein